MDWSHCITLWIIKYPKYRNVTVGYLVFFVDFLGLLEEHLKVFLDLDIILKLDYFNFLCSDSINYPKNHSTTRLNWLDSFIYFHLSFFFYWLSLSLQTICADTAFICWTGFISIHFHINALFCLFLLFPKLI